MSKTETSHSIHETLTRLQARTELNEKLARAFETIVLKCSEAIQVVVIAEYPAKNKRPDGVPPKAYLVACYMERTREEDALDAVLKSDGYWEFDFIDSEKEIDPTGKSKVVKYNIKGKLTIHYKGHDFVFNNGGEGDTYKSAISDAFKRCCGDTPLTRGLWQQKTVWVEYNKEVEKLFRYGSPTLKELGGEVDKKEIFLSKSPKLNTLNWDQMLQLEESKEIPETMMITNGNKISDLVLASYFTKNELIEFSIKNIPNEEIEIELAHRHNFVFVYSPKNSLIYSQLSKMKKKITDEQWDEWKELAKAENFKKMSADKQIDLISFFADGLRDVNEILEGKSKKATQ